MHPNEQVSKESSGLTCGLNVKTTSCSTLFLRPGLGARNRRCAKTPRMRRRRTDRPSRPPSGHPHTRRPGGAEQWPLFQNSFTLGKARIRYPPGSTRSSLCQHDLVTSTSRTPASSNCGVKAQSGLSLNWVSPTRSPVDRHGPGRPNPSVPRQ